MNEKTLREIDNIVKNCLQNDVSFQEIEEKYKEYFEKKKGETND